MEGTDIRAYVKTFFQFLLPTDYDEVHLDTVHRAGPCRSEPTGSPRNILAMLVDSAVKDRILLAAR